MSQFSSYLKQNQPTMEACREILSRKLSAAANEQHTEPFKLNSQILSLVCIKYYLMAKKLCDVSKTRNVDLPPTNTRLFFLKKIKCFC